MKKLMTVVLAMLFAASTGVAFAQEKGKAEGKGDAKKAEAKKDDAKKDDAKKGDAKKGDKK